LDVQGVYKNMWSQQSKAMEDEDVGGDVVINMEGGKGNAVES